MYYFIIWFWVKVEASFVYSALRVGILEFVNFDFLGVDV